MESKIHFPQRDVNVHTFYDKKIKYNIPEGPEKKEHRNEGKVKKPKYDPMVYGRVGYELIMGVDIMALARVLFHRPESNQYLIKMLKEGKSSEAALYATIHYTYERLRKRDSHYRDKNLTFSDVTLEYLDLLGINPDDPYTIEEKRILYLIDENGNIKSDRLHNIIKKIM